jgi:hypothetical protein
VAVEPKWQGPVFIMNVAITEDAHALLEKLPLEEEALTEADSTATASAELAS